LCADVGLALTTVELSNRISEKVETFLGDLNKSSLAFVHRQPEPCHQVAKCGHRLGTLSGSAANDQIIRIVDDPRAEFPFVPELLPGQHKSAKVQICKKRGTHPTNNLAKKGLTFDIVIPRSRLKSIRGQGPDFEVQADKEVTSTPSVEGDVHGREMPKNRNKDSGPS
jgi:hypothetical protein